MPPKRPDIFCQPLFGSARCGHLLYVPAARSAVRLRRRRLGDAPEHDNLGGHGDHDERFTSDEIGRQRRRHGQFGRARRPPTSPRTAVGHERLDPLAGQDLGEVRM